MKANQLFLLLIAGCGVSQASQPYGDDDGSGSNMGSGSGSSAPGGVFYGSVLDERSDTISFASTVPVHTHTGAAIDLSGGGCPAVYKYAYLESAQPPMYGSETAPNPLAFRITTPIANLDTTEYRVRDDNQQVLVDWTAMSPDANGVYAIDIRRDGSHGFAALGTTAGKMYVDARFRDTMGADTIETACWENHPLAAPLDVAPAVAGDLFAMSFANHSTISHVLNAGSFTDVPYGAPVTQIGITQYSSEPVTLSLTTTPPTGTGTRDVVDAYVLVDTYAVSTGCGAAPCATVPAPVNGSTNGDSAIRGTFQLIVTDVTNSQVVCRSLETDRFHVACTIPARATGEQPHPYQAQLWLSGEPSITPAHIPVLTPTYIDQLLGTTPQWITGTVDALYSQICVTQSIGHICLLEGDYKHVTAVENAKLAFDAIQFSLITGVGDLTTYTTPTYFAQPTFAARTWDSGLAGF